MDLERRTAQLYIRHAFRQMLDVADRLGDERVNERPLGPETNAVAALVVHCCGVTEFWVGHVALGRPSDRDRESEFSRTATVDELHATVDATLDRVSEDLDAIDAGKTQADRTGRQFLEGRGDGGFADRRRKSRSLRRLLEGGDESDGAIVLHVLEELYQHLGHMELAADALAVRG
jgi:hypothetical protein